MNKNFVCVYIIDEKQKPKRSNKNVNKIKEKRS
jgi:hypothetical protein